MTIFIKIDNELKHKVNKKDLKKNKKIVTNITI